MVGIRKFDENARRVLLFAHEEAVRMQSAQIGSEHILLGLLRDDGLAGKILAGFKLNLAEARRVVAEINPEKRISGGGRVDLQRSTQQILEHAIKITQKKQLDEIGSQHLLLALAELEDSLAHAALKRMGVQPESIRQSLSDSGV